MATVKQSFMFVRTIWTMAKAIQIMAKLVPCIKENKSYPLVIHTLCMYSWENKTLCHLDIESCIQTTSQNRKKKVCLMN